MNHQNINSLNPEMKNRVDMFSASSSMRGIKDLKLTLSLIQSACSLSLEGTRRATAGQVTERAIKDYGLDVISSFTGQVFTSLGISTVIIQGKKRLVLEPDQLEQVMKQIIEKIEQLSKKHESNMAAFQDISEKIKKLEDQWNEVAKQRARERELTNAITGARQTPSKLPYLEAEYRKIQVEAANIEEIQNEIESLNKKIKSLASLDEKRTALKTKIKDHEAKTAELTKQEQEVTKNEKALAEKEASLAARINKIQQRQNWVSFAEVEEAIENGEKELDQVLRQLGEKRSLLDKLLMRNKGVEPK